MPNLAYMESKYGISRRVLQRARAKLSRLDLIEHVGMLNSRHGGQIGWRPSGRFAAALQILAGKLGKLQPGDEPELKEKEKLLVTVLRA